MKTLFLAFASIVLLVSSVRAEMFDFVNIPAEEKYSLGFEYKGIDLNKPAIKPFSQRYIAAEAPRKADYITRVVGEGGARHVESEIVSTANNGWITKHLFKFLPGPKLVLASWEKSIFNVGGKKLRAEYYDLTETTPQLPRNLTHPFTLPLALRGFDFSPGASRDFYIWFNPTMVFMVRALYKGKESVTVPAGTFECHRIEVSPDLNDFMGPVFSKVIRPVVASYVTWVDTKPPHRLVKYQGPFGMVNVAGPTETFQLSKIGD